jgi:hypothetical protein
VRGQARKTAAVCDRSHTGQMHVRIEAYDLPGAECGSGPDWPDGHPNVHVAVQRRNKPSELMGVVKADVTSATWDLECSCDGTDVTGPYVQGGPGGRFVYLSWGVIDEEENFTMFRRAKLLFDGVPSALLGQAQRTGVLIGRLGLTDSSGNPLCAAVRPPLIEWSAGLRREKR